MWSLVNEIHDVWHLQSKLELKVCSKTKSKSKSVNGNLIFIHGWHSQLSKLFVLLLFSSVKGIWEHFLWITCLHDLQYKPFFSLLYLYSARKQYIRFNELWLLLLFLLFLLFPLIRCFGFLTSSSFPLWLHLFLNFLWLP